MAQETPLWEKEFSRPRDLSAPRRHLYVANCGRDEAAIRAAFNGIENDYGVEEVLVHPVKSFTYITFRKVEQAVAAKDRLNKKESEHIPNRKLYIEFASRKRIATPGEEIECTSCSTGVTVDGLYLIENFVSEAEEAVLMNHIDYNEHNNKRNQSQSVNDEDAYCCICGREQTNDTNYILFCDGCNLAVHQQCYGIPITTIPPGNWYCARCTPDGLPPQHVGCVLCSEEENKSFDWIDKLSRRVQHFGFEFSYDTKNVDASKSLGLLPPLFSPLTNRMEKWFLENQTPFSRKAAEWDQLTINEYMPGQGISPHFDTHSAFEDGICSLSLLSDVVMYFDKDSPNSSSSKNEDMEEKEKEKEVGSSPIHKHLVLPRRSLLIMTGEARYRWRHAILHRKTDKIDGELIKRQRRVSLTFRRVKRSPCECIYPQYCDSQQQQHPHQFPVDTFMTHKKEKAEAQDDVEDRKDQASLAPTKEEEEHVHKVYDNIAAHFSHTRKAKWPKVVEFLSNRPAGTLVADIGCGNGKYLNSNNECCFVGCDRSAKLIDICKDRGFEVFVCDALKVPFRDSCFDLTMSIAVLHHLSTLDHRLHALRELVRVTRVGGEILVCAWAVEQDELSKRKFGEEQDVYVPWNLQQKFVSQSPDLPSVSHSVVNEGKGVIVYQRYCHLHQEGELEKLAGLLKGVELVRAFYDNSNWFVWLRKSAI